eukprot:TRINITY_DN1630_c0_g3_i1.p4 TRINITY_DN1630_c0_g3~~TRINITY_DN1630_c0_g3_i1.p4  ORF type:complete len:102 (-),score=40.12 TRINITY_DN1630_c0_g3_i1:711-1016(-)
MRMSQRTRDSRTRLMRNNEEKNMGSKRKRPEDGAGGVSLRKVEEGECAEKNELDQEQPEVVMLLVVEKHGHVSERRETIYTFGNEEDGGGEEEGIGASIVC